MIYYDMLCYDMLCCTMLQLTPPPLPPRMPVTPVSARLFDASFGARQWPLLGSRLADIPVYAPACSANAGVLCYAMLCYATIAAIAITIAIVSIAIATELTALFIP
jgi:hypothetical protein